MSFGRLLGLCAGTTHEMGEGADRVGDCSRPVAGDAGGPSESIDRYDPSRGARFSTWLLAIAKHVLGDELEPAACAESGREQESGGAG